MRMSKRPSPREIEKGEFTEKKEKSGGVSLTKVFRFDFKKSSGVQKNFLTFVRINKIKIVYICSRNT
jgi:hypothetical protein